VTAYGVVVGLVFLLGISFVVLIDYAIWKPNPLCLAVLAVVLLLAAAMIEVRHAADRRKVAVVTTPIAIAKGTALSSKTVVTVKVAREHARGYLRNPADVERRFTSRALNKDTKLTAGDIDGVESGHRPFAIALDASVTVSGRFSAGDRLDLAFAAAKGLDAEIVPGVILVETADDPSRVIVSLDDAQTEQVLAVLGRTRLVITSARS